MQEKWEKKAFLIFLDHSEKGRVKTRYGQMVFCYLGEFAAGVPSDFHDFKFS